MHELSIEGQKKVKRRFLGQLAELNQLRRSGVLGKEATGGVAQGQINARLGAI